jgi:8-oxo-dGTP pyrophosphatase MutT (NUDIX family)
VLVIHRNAKLGQYEVPKGHVEAGETAEMAAVREVEEEAGVTGVLLHEEIHRDRYVGVVLSLKAVLGSRCDGTAHALR